MAAPAVEARCGGEGAGGEGGGERGQDVGGIAGMSPRKTKAPAASGGRLAMPARRVAPMPSAWSAAWMMRSRAASPVRSANARAASLDLRHRRP